ncbi:urea amidolyase [Alphaproteobacteria bacterium GH1-50]|uniref:Urea amidolyase n=1 Tax=Kangsaoukella pontilimi TaxID=2691042 RepID=A0A7C9MZL2_9RHOB|nr:biotin-dependent carboxyltransferase family protein [Kangsaoukella pontilimi]MXQ07578.1 urea amidolyase [Kangsaoukella pontilimi]
MSRALIVSRAAPGMTVQDLGRPGYLRFGLSRGGAADRSALVEAGALLGQDQGLAAIEMTSVGGTFEATEDVRIALTGAPMRATLDGARLAWNASHLLPAGVPLVIGPAEEGTYGYLSVGGGLSTPEILGSRSAHLTAGIGGAIESGAELPVGPDGGTTVNMALSDGGAARRVTGPIRIVSSLQTALFPEAERARFEATVFHRDARANRMGGRLLSEGEGFAAEAGLTILSEVVVPGDIQITGDGTPFILSSECQTTGGYPRIGAVLPSDLPRVVQARPETDLHFVFVTPEEATEIERNETARRAGLRQSLVPLVRDPWKMRDLLSYGLVGGVVNAHDADAISY